MTSYSLDHFTMADARPLIGAIADITEWGDDNLETKATYPGARVTGIIPAPGPYLVIETAGAIFTDADDGQLLGSCPPAPELRVPFTYICEITIARRANPPAEPA